MGECNFIDRVVVRVNSGKGGAGSAHLHRAKFIEKGGPDGGDGGRGGDIIIKGNRNISTLLHLRYTKHMSAGNGGPGQKNRRFGADGEDKIIEVPLGTIVNNADTGEFILEIKNHDELAILAKGGRGGLGNDHFKSPTNQTPRYAQPGEPGIELWAEMELKIMADVGLVGMPNAGKSTLLSVVSAAKPKIANYPFTTLVPQMGIVKYKENSFAMADIPGIIEGAADGKGLGLQFLRHIQRNSLLLFIVSSESVCVKSDYFKLLYEIEKYDISLLSKPRILAISKAELIGDNDIKKIGISLSGVIDFIFISSAANYNLDLLIEKLYKTISN